MGAEEKSQPGDDQEKTQARDLAIRVLRGEALASPRAYRLAEGLRKQNEFGLARRLYGRIWRGNDTKTLEVTRVKLGQRRALATYKDPDLPAAERFRRAIAILDSIEELDFSAHAEGLSADRRALVDRKVLEIQQRQESFGLRGAIHKRRWQVEGQRADLELARGYYTRGYQLGRSFQGNPLGTETDQGYNGINAAYVLDLLAREEATLALATGVKPKSAIAYYRQAQEIRVYLATKLRLLLQSEKFSFLANEWWFYATIAEANYGIGEFKTGLDALREFNVQRGSEASGPPMDRIAPWEVESTLTQLASLIQLQQDLERLLSTDRIVGSAGVFSAANWANEGRPQLVEYLGPKAPALDRAERGKVGLALSGGGFRAALFHIGVLASLAERDMLRHVEVLSCVSGGSIVGAHYYLELKRLLETIVDGQVTQADYIQIIRNVERDFVAGVQRNLRGRALASIWANLRTTFQPGYTTTRYLGSLYERELFARVKDGAGERPRCLPDLFIRPLGEGAHFKPKYDNWRRAAKVSTLVLNATTLNTGHNWQFTASWMGEPPSSIDSEIESNYRLRRMYHRDAPRLKDRWRHWYSEPFSPPDYQRMQLGEAVAASSCVPGLFEPLVLPGLYDGKTVRLVDGGVHDNQGIASLLEQDCTFLIVSDASGQMEVQDQPGNGRASVLLRSSSVSMARVRQSQYRDLVARERSGLLRGLMFMHLKKDLSADPIDWHGSQDPYNASEEAREADPVATAGTRTSYDFRKDIQQLLAGIRTDLDSFTDLEASALMLSGYRQTGVLFQRLRWTNESPNEQAWEFLKVAPLLEDGPQFENVSRQLRTSSSLALKVWRLAVPLTVIGVLLVLAAVHALYIAWREFGCASLVSVRSLGIAAVVLLASLAVPQLVAIARFRQTIRSFGLRGIVGVFAALLFKLHLAVFDRIYLRIGNLDQLLNKRDGAPS